MISLTYHSRRAVWKLSIPSRWMIIGRCEMDWFKFFVITPIVLLGGLIGWIIYISNAPDVYPSVWYPRATVEIICPTSNHTVFVMRRAYLLDENPSQRRKPPQYKFVIDRETGLAITNIDDCIHKLVELHPFHESSSTIINELTPFQRERMKIMPPGSDVSSHY